MEKNLNKRDKYGLYIYASNYQEVRDRIVATEKNHAQEKLNKIPKWIRQIFNAV